MPLQTITNSKLFHRIAPAAYVHKGSDGTPHVLLTVADAEKTAKYDFSADEAEALGMHLIKVAANARALIRQDAHNSVRAG